MPFKPGQSGNPNGRPVGLLAQRTRDLREKARKLGCDPIEVMIYEIQDLLKAAKKEPEDSQKRRETRMQAVDVATRLAPYLHPKLATIEIGGEVDHRHAHLHAVLNTSGLDMNAYSPEQLRAIEDFTRLIGASSERPDTPGSVAGGSARVEPPGEE